MGSVRVGSAVLVVDDRRVLLGRRGKQPNFGRWVLPGGKVALYFSALAGIVMLLVATRTRAGTMPFIALVGIGSSVIASALFVFITASRERASVVLVDQGVEQLFDNRGYAFDDGYWESLLEQ